MGVGGVLRQDVKGTLLPVACMSKKLLPYQRKYFIVEKEAAVVLLSLEKLSVKPDSERKVIIYSDHNPLKFVNSMKRKNAR